MTNDLSVELVFELARLLVPVAELETRQPGYTFELNVAADGLLPIRVNGRVVARGTLVQVGDRLGVTLREIMPNAT